MKKIVGGLGTIALLMSLLYALGPQLAPRPSTTAIPLQFDVARNVPIEVLKPCSAGYVRLTFDDGPDPVNTPKILEALRMRDSKATFFVIGAKVERYPDLVRQTLDAGHGVGNHTWTHAHLKTLTPRQIELELSKTTEAIIEATGERPTEWRPPYEEYTAEIDNLAEAQRLNKVMWNYPTDTNDWAGKSPEQIRDAVLDNSFDGSIVLMHDTIANTVAAVPMIVDGLQRKGICTK